MGYWEIVKNVVDHPMKSAVEEVSHGEVRLVMPLHSWQLMCIVHIIFHSGSLLMLAMTLLQVHFILLCHACLAGEYDAVMLILH